MRPNLSLISSIAIGLALTGSLSLAQNSGLSLDQLMGGSPAAPSPAQPQAPQQTQQALSSEPVEQTSSSNLSLDQLLAPSRSSSTALDASLDLGTIQEGRQLAIRRDAASQLSDMDRQIRQRCSCTASSCYDLRNLNISQTSVIDAANEAETALNDQVTSVCQNWPGAGSTNQDLAMIQTRTDIANGVMGALNQIDSAANNMASQLEQQDAEIRYAIAQQEEQNSGFNWGQFAAMSVGVVAGGIGNLDVNTQAEIMSSIVADSFNGGGGMTNFQSTMDSLNADLASMQQSFNTGSGYDLPSYEMPSIDTSTPMSGGPSMGGGGNAGFDPSMAPSSIGGPDSSAPTSSSASSGVIQETYSFSCPNSTTQGSVPIVADSPACAAAMRNYGKVMSCNLIDEMESAQRQYESACAAEIY